MCGCVGAPHWGHVVSVVGVAFQFARRERVLERDVFRFGTATSVPLLLRVGAPAWPLRADHRGSITSWWWSGSSARCIPHSEHNPGQSSRHTGWNGSVGTTASRSTGSRSMRSPTSSYTSSSSVVGAHLVVVRRPIGVGEQLLEVPVDLEVDGVQAPHAGTGRRAADRTRDEHPFDDGLEAHLDLDARPRLRAQGATQ